MLVYRLITANTIDQRILERAEGKRKLEKMIIHEVRRCLGGLMTPVPALENSVSCSAHALTSAAPFARVASRAKAKSRPA